ncbi:conserved hypothetical protein [Hahella chejuensis KCTC 2396]|uniref:Uncharacterized protein n=1 Tax=Hahella chejuensis (strain KCTC 2396) TaxID=349521 RepID=Q2SQV7_HAHCH|nr:hypothetical protein [Hahella chejuensis]ABC26967.1 conserved hypothetical protein [Hahella chejuensis KCTC 2396]
MSLAAVYEIINQAKAAELKTQNYAKWLRQQLDSLHRVIELNGSQPVEDLIHFVIDYIELAPRLVECVAHCAAASRTEKLFAPFIEKTIHYFAHPSVLVLRHTGLDCLLIMAYQSHRLVEEVYENNRSLRNSPICDLQATQANLLAHHLIGEPFANELDQATHLTVRQMVSLPDFYHLDLSPFLVKTNTKRWRPLNEDWLNLLDKHHIRMSFQPRC